MKKTNLIPKRRFREFHNENGWNQLNLKNIAPLQRGFDLTKSSMKRGPYPVVFSNGIGAWNSEYKVKGPGVVTGRSGSIGNVSYIEDDYWPHNTSLWVTSFYDNYPLFIYYLYQSVDLTRFGSGSGVPTLNRNDVHDYSTSVPRIEEQTRIGNFLKHIEDIINLHQRKLEKSKALKSAYLSEMFPAEGECEPKRRFAGFTQAWKQKTVSDLADRYDNLRIPITASDRVAGKTPYYGANGIQDYVEGFTHDGEFILIAEDGANDLQNYPVHYVNGKVWVNNHAHVLQAKTAVTDNKFLMNAMKHLNIEPYLVGGGRAKLNADVMMKISLQVPELEEQKLIGSFFASLDHLIGHHQRKLDKLQNLKKAYLHEMFV
ncbi:restriction endonuclease subunit S [Fictibacillus sp. 7GRE50]|uniref:restriction endonuclease subunit S n=1 Tax=Fictibacillus sp. 7GRE50 TaxID=2745878 RepID=UPI0018CEED30|nr:restriction endonuclease subunit S [Fictibacillus sp. 7GRE50]MBH0167214.1 restriction endonuclease subunit S [Fictibacillus sp. 7GRE50]